MRACEIGEEAACVTCKYAKLLGRMDLKIKEVFNYGIDNL